MHFFTTNATPDGSDRQEHKQRVIMILFHSPWNFGGFFFGADASFMYLAPLVITCIFDRSIEIYRTTDIKHDHGLVRFH